MVLAEEGAAVCGMPLGKEGAQEPDVISNGDAPREAAICDKADGMR